MARTKKAKYSYTWESDLIAEISAYEALAAGAELKTSWQAATMARSHVSRLKRELARLKEEAALEGKESPSEQLHRRSRRAAEEGSWQAAAALASQARSALEAEELAASQVEEDVRTADQIAGDLVDALRLLPTSLRDRVILQASSVDADVGGYDDDHQD